MEIAREVARRGRNLAPGAVADTMIIIAYHMLRHVTHYKDLRASYFDERDKRAVVRRSVNRLERIGTDRVGAPG